MKKFECYSVIIKFFNRSILKNEYIKTTVIWCIVKKHYHYISKLKNNFKLPLVVFNIIDIKDNNVTISQTKYSENIEPIYVNVTTVDKKEIFKYIENHNGTV